MARIANIGEPGLQVPAEDGDHPATEGVDRRPRLAAELVGREQAGQAVEQLFVHSREIPLCEGSVVREVVLEVEVDHDRGVTRVGAGPRPDGAKPGAKAVGAWICPGVHDSVAGLVVTSAVAGEGERIVVNVELDEPDPAVELTANRAEIP